MSSSMAGAKRGTVVLYEEVWSEGGETAVRSAVGLTQV